MKTQLCKNFRQGRCSYGSRCHFAHGEHQLQQQVGPWGVGGGIRLWVQMGERGTAGIGCLDCSN